MPSPKKKKLDDKAQKSLFSFVSEKPEKKEKPPETKKDTKTKKSKEEEKDKGAQSLQGRGHRGYDERTRSRKGAEEGLACGGQRYGRARREDQR